MLGNLSIFPETQKYFLPWKIKNFPHGAFRFFVRKQNLVVFLKYSCRKYISVESIFGPYCMGENFLSEENNNPLRFAEYFSDFSRFSYFRYNWWICENWNNCSWICKSKPPRHSFRIQFTVLHWIMKSRSPIINAPPVDSLCTRTHK